MRISLRREWPTERRAYCDLTLPHIPVAGLCLHRSKSVINIFNFTTLIVFFNSSGKYVYRLLQS